MKLTDPYITMAGRKTTYLRVGLWWLAAIAGFAVVLMLLHWGCAPS